MTSPITPAAELENAVADTYADPLKFVMMAFPWGESGGPLADLKRPYKWQEEFLRDVGADVLRRKFNGVDPVPALRYSVSSGHGVGKSTLVGWLVCWILSTRPDCKITVTANTVTQLETKTWASIQTWMGHCITRDWFEVTQTRIRHRHFPARWFASAQTCREENSEAFAGQHAANSSSVFIYDEASAISDKIKEVSEGGLVKGEPMMFAFGNPTRNSGWFFRANFGAEMPLWNHRCVDSRDAGGGDEQIASWLDQYGEDSDFFRVRVRGLPPRASDLQFISPTLVQEARNRNHEPLDDEPLVAGFDAANGGLAHFVIAFRRGLDAKNVPPAIRLPGDTPRDVIVGKIAEIMGNRDTKKRVAALFGDQAFGSVILARVQNLGYSNVFEVNFGGEAPDKKHHGNMRAHMWSAMREWLRIGALPDSDDLENDLTAPGFHIRPNGQLILESKQDMAKRGVKSPDWGDALALTFARRVAPPTKPSAIYRQPVSTWG